MQRQDDVHIQGTNWEILSIANIPMTVTSRWRT